jgi:hypothetical protein
LERLKQGKYNKPHWLRYIRGALATGPYRKKEEEEEEEEEERSLVTGPVWPRGFQEVSMTFGT